MELTTKELSVEYMRRMASDTVYQELSGDVFVPEGMPDVARTVDAFGTVILQQKRCEDGELRLTGGVQAGVLYVPEGEGEPCTLEAWLPFSIRKSVDTHDGCVIAECFLKRIEAKTVNGRKLLLRGELGVTLQRFVPEQLRLGTVTDAPSSLQMQQKSYPVQLPVACGEQEFRVQDELTLPESSPAMERILKWQISPSVTESRMIGNKAVFQGEVAVQALYLGADGSVNTYVGRLPYSQFVELSGEWPDGSVAVFPAITSAQVETDGQMESRTLLVDLNLLAQVCVIDRILLTLTEDAYAVGGTLSPEWQQISMQPLLDTQTVQTQAEIAVPCQAQQVIDLSLWADQPVLRRGQDGLSANASLSGSVLYTDENGALMSKSLHGSCGCVTQTDGDCRSLARCRMNGTPVSSLGAGELRIRVPMTLTLDVWQDAQWQNLAGGEITQTDAPKGPAVLVRRWHGGDLWPLAKELGATVADIEAANGITGTQAPEKDVLLIPMR